MLAAPVGSSIFYAFALVVITLLVLLLLRYYLPLRSTPAYILVPVFLAVALPANLIILVPIDLASNPLNDEHPRGLWLLDRALLVAWRISYWLTFVLTW
jgi:LMBR1-like membrane protein